MKKQSRPSNAQKLIRFLRGNKDSISPLLILTHDFPDPDAIAGACALQFLAETAFGIRSRIVYRGVIGRMENRNMVRMLKLPMYKLRPWEINKYAHVALVDTQPQFENNPFPENRKATLVIDQHPPGTAPLADCAVVDTKCGATCVLLAQAILALKMDMPKRLATALAYGILSDTLYFYRAWRKDIIETYSRLIALCDMHVLALIQTPLYEKGYFLTLGRVLDRAVMCGDLVVCHLGKTGSPDLVSQMADILLSYRPARWSFCTGRFGDKLYVSLRTRTTDVPAFTILRKCFPAPEDAGGHGQIAGGSLRVGRAGGKKWKREERVLAGRLLKHLGLSGKTESHRPFEQRKIRKG